MQKASDSSVYAYIEYSASLLESLQDKPASCIAFNNGTYLDPRDLGPGTLERMLDIKADVFESVTKNPVQPVNMTSDEMVAAVRGVSQEGLPNR